jgi:hypothetical protein
MILVHDFLDFRVCAEMSEVIPVCLPLYVSWHFSFQAFSILFSFSRFGILIMMFHGVVLF